MNGLEMMQLLQQHQAGNLDLSQIPGIAGNPHAALIGELLKGRQQAEPERSELADTEVTYAREQAARVSDVRRELSELAAALDTLRQQNEALLERLADERALREELTSALGACPCCAGRDPHCRLCRGRGEPGFVGSDQIAFERWVVPAVRAYALRRRHFLSSQHQTGARNESVP